MTTSLLDGAQLRDFTPLAERAVSVDAASLIRFRRGPATVAGYVRLPYDVLAGRTLALQSLGDGSFDATVSAADFLRWVDDPAVVPVAKDAHWLSALPPRAGWQRVELVPDSVIRDLIRSGASLAPDAASRRGQEALLASVVLTATAPGQRVEVPLGPLSALTRMGFLPRDAQAAVDVAPGWIRVATTLGSTFVSTGNALGMLSL
jgi:hypothetical protein